VALAILALAAALRTRAALRHLRRLKRAAKLVPGERPDGEVMVGGKAPEQTVQSPPGRKLEAAAWQMAWFAGPRTSHPATLRLVSDDGTLLVDLVNAELHVDGDHSEWLDDEAGKRLAMDLGVVAGGPDHEPLGETSGEASAEDHPAGEHATERKLEHTAGTFSWLEPRRELYVVGVPAWEGGHGGGGYRDAAVVPVFRSQGDQAAWLVDRPAREEQAHARWILLSWAVWGSACAAVGVGQLIGWL
jgi:hypothetical protein